VFVESESKKVGRLHAPDTLIQAMRLSTCIQVEVPEGIRAGFLIDEYAHWTQDRLGLQRKLDHIAPLHSKQKIAHWQSLIESEAWPAFVENLLVEHYDPAYDRAMARNFQMLASAWTVRAEALDSADIEHMARQISIHVAGQP
jgi:tRNA 2-selenouridine synthase